MMFKKLAIPFLTLTIAALGACSSSSSTTDAGSGGAGTGGAGTGGAGTGGAATDGSVDMSTTETAAETGTETGAETMSEAGGGTTTGDICASGYPNATMKLTVAAADFCAKYATVCTFGGSMRYTDLTDCMTKYVAVGSDQG